MSVALADAVGTLRIRTREDGPAVRSVVAGAVRRSNLHPPGRSPRAVLVVRRLEHRLAWAPGMPVPTGPAARGLADDVEAAWRCAERPADGPIGAGALAVWFADVVELLAVFCEDAAVDAIARHWWWDVLSGSLAPGGRVVEALERHAAVAPQVLMELERRATSRRVLAALTQPEAADLTVAVAEAHGAARVARAVRRRSADGSLESAGRSGPARSVATDPPITGSHHLLLNVSRLVAAADPRVRSVEFAQDAEGRLSAAAPDDAVGTGSHEAAGTATDPAAHRPARDRRTDDPQPTGPAVGPEPGPVGARVADERARASTTRARRPPQRDETGPGRGPGEEALADTRADRAGPPALMPAHDGVDPAAGPEASPGLEPAGVATRLGGVFFLVEVLRELDLPDAFEDPWRLASRLGGWGTLELLARSLVPAEAPWPHDPTWQVLADLGGGAGALAPERSLPARARGGLPPAWRTVRLDHVEAPALDGTLAAPATQGRRRWIELVRPFVVDLLVARVGLPATELFEGVLMRPARVDADRTHVEVVLPISTASVPVRRAGLDRDPGWVPQLGRVVSFRFDPDHVP